MQLDWKRHKPACLSRRHAEPYIAHIDFDRSTTDYSPWFKPVLDAVKSRTYALVANPTELRSLLAHPILPSAILCTTAELAEKKYAYVRASLRTYVEQGGRVVVGGPGINHLKIDEIPRLLSSLGGVSWQVEGYHRTTHYLNPAHPLYAAEGDSAARAALPASYSCKAIVLKNVDPGEMVYRSTGDSGVESLAMAMHGGKVASDEVAVATAKVGEGWLSWVGDVNQEAGSTAAMPFLLGVKR